MDTLSKFVVTMRQVPVHKPLTELGIKFLHLMSLKAAKGLMLQCGGQYGFAEVFQSFFYTDYHTRTFYYIQT